MTPWTVACQAPVHWILQARILEWIAISFSKGIFLIQESNLGLLHCRQILYQLSYEGNPIMILSYSILVCHLFLPKTMADVLPYIT